MKRHLFINKVLRIRSSELLEAPIATSPIRKTRDKPSTPRNTTKHIWKTKMTDSWKTESWWNIDYTVLTESRNTKKRCSSIGESSSHWSTCLSRKWKRESKSGEEMEKEVEKTTVPAWVAAEIVVTPCTEFKSMILMMEMEWRLSRIIKDSLYSRLVQRSMENKRLIRVTLSFQEWSKSRTSCWWQRWEKNKELLCRNLASKVIWWMKMLILNFHLPQDTTRIRIHSSIKGIKET